ncbi:MAG: hypothetical protein KF903_11700 [Dokdonella sp.]|uniref:DUF4139 domain-containing protein n=1 Tax=Dokdonella sp. TaxID=2291710 RepID=UPI0025BAD734|nr:hypothetical protein [Dokdonella sp.]MBX3701645.1 hypothetical protein [Dokdonella sp.]
MNPLPLALAAMMTTLSASAAAADTALTIYRADGDALFSPGSQPLDEGHAVVHEKRSITLAGGRHDLAVGGLPTLLDSEAVSIDFGGAARVLGQRVIAPGDAGLLGAHRGERILVRGANHETLAEGELIAVDGDGLGVRDAQGHISYLRNYVRVEFPDSATLAGSSLQVALEVARGGRQDAMLDYPTSGLGWRAAYAALLDDGGKSCRLRLDALASIANRSGRDYRGSTLKLIAGSPNFASGGYSGPPRMMAMKVAAAPAPEALPEQSALGDYRSYVIDGALDLPDASVTQVPLYASRELDCTRRWLVESGGSWFPATPNWQDGGATTSALAVTSQVLFTAPENLPAGRVRVLTRDRDGQRELLGEARSADTAKGREVTLNLGAAFGLRGERERTTFSLDRAARTLDEGFRITLENGSDSARRFTLREHPNRWRAWQLASSSQPATRKTPDLLEFVVEVPAHGKATLDYLVRYTWTASDERS